MIVVKAYKGAIEFPKAYKGTQLLYEAGGSLPKEYQQVEYIQTTSCAYRTNYIDTGLYANVGTVVEAVFEFVSSFWDWGRIFGDDPGSTMDGMDFCGGDPNSMDFRYAGQSINYGFNVAQQYKVTFGNNAVYVDDVLVRQFTVSSWGSNPTLKLFSSNADRDGAFKMYSCKITQDGVLVRDFVPCYRKSDQEPGFYDLVNGVFYTNQGSVPFLVGGNV